jgi:hypothetical protein
MKIRQVLKHLKLLKLSIDIRKFHKFHYLQYFDKLLNIYIFIPPKLFKNLFILALKFSKPASQFSTPASLGLI